MTGNHLDFQEVYTTFHAKIRGYLCHMLEENDAEELTQDVFAKIAKALEGFRGDAKLSTWVYRIATNAALDRIRSASFKQQRREDAQDASQGPDMVESQGRNVWTGEKQQDAEHQVIRREMNKCIRDYINQLPEDYRVVLLLSDVEGFKNPEIAEILKISLDCVKIRLHRARVKLKDSLGRHCCFYLDERGELACDRKKSCTPD